MTESSPVGSNHSAGTLRLRAFLAQNACVYTYLDLDRDPAVQWLLDQFAVRPEEVPILICRERTVLRNPSNAKVAAVLDVRSRAEKPGMWDIEMAGPPPAER